MEQLGSSESESDWKPARKLLTNRPLSNTVARQELTGNGNVANMLILTQAGIYLHFHLRHRAQTSLVVFAFDSASVIVIECLLKLPSRASLIRSES